MTTETTPITWLKAQRGPGRKGMTLAVGLGLLGGFLVIFQAHFLAKVVDAAVMHGQGLALVMPWMWALLGIFALRALIAWSAEQAAFRAAVDIKLAIRRQLYAHLNRLGPVHLADARSGELATVLTDGVEALEDYYARFLPAVSLMALVPLAILAFVFPIDGWSGVILLVTAPFIPLFMVFIGKGAEKLNQRQWRRLARMGAHFLDVVQGLTTLKLFNASRREAQMVARISDEYRRSTMSVLRVAFLSSLALEFFATVSIALVAVLIGFRLLWGEIDFEAAFFVLLLAPEFYLPLRSMSGHYHARMQAVGAAEGMVELLEKQPPAQPDTMAAEFPAGRLSIALKQVEFAYEPGRPALAGLDLDIAADERIALVGASGAGKSTVANLLLGFARPDAGRITVNDQDLAGIDREAWFRQVAWLPQRPHLFQGSIRDNLKLARPDANDSQLIDAATHAQLLADIDSLPDGWDSEVGERGQGLSGGQVQRLALARAFLKDAPLVILDEAAAHLDPATETALSAAIDRLADGRTMLVIAHRLASVQQADRIVVLDQGRVAESGRPVELAAAGGLYSELLNSGELQ